MFKFVNAGENPKGTKVLAWDPDCFPACAALRFCSTVLSWRKVFDLNHIAALLSSCDIEVLLVELIWRFA